MDKSKIFSQIVYFARVKNLPMIPFNAEDATFIRSPNDFYQSVADGVRSAKRRIFLSALYLGTDHKEAALVQELANKLDTNPSITVRINLDANRATRQNSNGQSSHTILEDLMYRGRFQLKLIDTSKASQGYIAIWIDRYKKLKEIFSTYHTKALVFDDNVILTGANLSHIYFDNRQDRYLLIENTKLLANYINDLLTRVANARPYLVLSKIASDHHRYFFSMHPEVQSYFQIPRHDSYIIPLLQHKKSALTDLDDFLEYLKWILPPKATVHLSSGYFNPCFDLKLHSVLAPSEAANGFYNGSGLLRFVPNLYDAIMERYARLNPNCCVKTFDRENWSFHAKGLWVENLDDVYIHLIGSSNFNCRSSKRDFETQFLIVTNNRSLIDKLRGERDSLWLHSSSFVQRSTNRLYKAFSSILSSLL